MATAADTNLCILCSCLNGRAQLAHKRRVSAPVPRELSLCDCDYELSGGVVGQHCACKSRPPPRAIIANPSREARLQLKARIGSIIAASISADRAGAPSAKQ